MGIIIHLLIFVGTILTPIFAIRETNESATCGNHTCANVIAGEVHLQYTKNGCFCDALCHFYNDCCRDYKPIPLHRIETPTAECLSPSKNNHTIMMITSCPASFNGVPGLVEMCQMESPELMSSIPVSGRQKQLVYRNFYCALCNGEDNYTFWTQKLNCPMITASENITLDMVNLTDCVTSFQNPYPNTSHLCIEGLVKRCMNSTAGKCETEKNGVVYSDMKVYYKNHHCFQCNKKTNEKLICGALPNTWVSTMSLSYFILIDFNRRDVRSNGNKQFVTCEPGHWFNYIKRKCQPVPNPPMNCPLLRLERHEYTLLANETLYRNSTKTFFAKGTYMIGNKSEVFVCRHEQTGSSLENLLTFIGMGISWTALTFLIFMYMFMPAVWNLTGMIYLSFSFALFLAQGMFLISRYATHHDSCQSVAITVHYAFLASFFWLNVVSVNIWFTVCRNPCETTSRNNRKRFFFYSLYAWLTPLAIIISAVLLDKHRGDSKFAPRYGYSGVCWLNNNDGHLLFFAIPLAVIILVNLAAYIHTAVTIYKMRQFSVNNSSKGNIKTLIINTKLCLLTGVTWSVGYIASVSDSKELPIIFIILNATYGLWLAICFLMSENIFSSMKQRFNVSQSSSTKTMI